MDSEELREEYSKSRRRKYIFIAACVVLTFIFAWISLGVGTRELSFSEVFRLLDLHFSGYEFPERSQDAFDDNIIWDYRIPRTLLAVIAGAILAIAGSVMQSVMKNPLADPYTTGVSSGALFGVAIAMVLGFSVGHGIFGSFGTIANAIIFSLIPVVVIVVMSPFFRKSPSTLILAGVATSYLFNSLTALMLVSTNEETLEEVYHWEVGNLAELGWEPVWVLLVVLIIGAGILWPMANKLNLMSLDDKDAKALGLDGRKLRVLCLTVLTLMTSFVIAFTGIIGFVGLVIPHMVRMVLGSDNRFIIPAAMAFGSFFLLFCDIIARSVDVGASIPIGVVTSLIGAPIFLYLIIRQKKGIW
ncbi:MAG: iron ABC transporter permease [Candidatus Methanomethylophilaceae archaeon]|nr:iron ABC transporter permease [Candidatus Methanomethylophilaceae archaeon]